MNDFGFLTMMLFGGLAEMAGTTSDEVINDFTNFSKEVDRVKEELNLSEDDALAYVAKDWKFPFAPTTED